MFDADRFGLLIEAGLDADTDVREVNVEGLGQRELFPYRRIVLKEIFELLKLVERANKQAECFDGGIHRVITAGLNWLWGGSPDSDYDHQHEEKIRVLAKELETDRIAVIANMRRSSIVSRVRKRTESPRQKSNWRTPRQSLRGQAPEKRRPGERHAKRFPGPLTGVERV